MSTQITTAFVNQFSANVHTLAQQKGSKLRQYVRTEAMKGEAAFFERIGLKTAQEKTSRHAQTTYTDTPHTRRRVTARDWFDADLVDKEDQLRLLIDPKSHYANAIASAIARQMDAEIVRAALDVAYTVDGSTSSSMGTDNRICAVASSALSNLNLLALRTAKFKMDQDDVEDEGRHFAINASALMSLLSDSTITSADFNAVKALVQGELNSFLGFQFHRCERITTQLSSFAANTTTGVYDSGGTTSTAGKSCFAWQEQGILLGIWKDIMGRITEESTKHFAWQVYASASFGGVRMEENRVVEVICAQ